MQEGLVIRPFDIKKDLPGAVACFCEGFHHIMWPFIDQAAPGMVEDIIRLFYVDSPDSFAAEIDGQVHGILLGAAPMHASGLARLLGLFAGRVTPRISVNAYKMSGLAYRHLFQILYGYAPFLFLHPRVWPLAEINLFTSRRQYRGKGMGKRLMDAFMEKVRAGALTGAYVCTDTALSYHFYEGYGFERVKKFPMKAYRFSLGKESHEGRIYHYHLD